MKKYLLAIAAITSLMLSSAAMAQTTIAKWTFENLTIAAGSSLTNFSNGRSITNITPEFGSGNASGSHPGTPAFGAGTWSTVTGNGSAKALTSAGWTNNPAASTGDYYQFAFSTVGFTNIGITFDTVGSATGPKNFIVQYSTDGVTYTTFGSPYTVLSSPSWSASTPVTGETDTYDFSSITSLANQGVVYIRLVVTGNTAINGGLIGSGGTSRVDNFTVSATSLVNKPQLLTDISSTNSYAGNQVVFSVLVSGDSPLSYQWYYPNLSTQLADGGSGFGAGTIAGSQSNILTLNYIDPAQAGNYQVIITNNAGSVTSSVANLTIGTRTPITNNIAFLRTLLDPINWKPIDVTNIYCATGIVTSIFNFTSGNNSEFFMQDATGRGISVFEANNTSVPNPGTIVRVTGPLGQFDGLLEFQMDANNQVQSISTLGTTTVPAPAYFDINNITNTPFLETNVEGSLVVVSNVFLNRSSAQFISGASVNMTNANGKFLALFVNANASDVIAANVPVFATSVIGHFGQFTSSTPATGGYELDIMQYADLVDGNSTPPTPLMSARQSGTNSIVSWNDIFFTVQMATNVSGPYTDLTNGTPLVIPSTNPAAFFRVHYP